MSEARAPEVRVSDARASDARASDARASDARASDARASDAKVSDTRTSDSRASETRASEARTSESRASETRASEARTPEARAHPPESRNEARVQPEARNEARPVARASVLRPERFEARPRARPALARAEHPKEKEEAAPCAPKETRGRVKAEEASDGSDAGFEDQLYSLAESEKYLGEYHQRIHYLLTVVETSAQEFADAREAGTPSPAVERGILNRVDEIRNTLRDQEAEIEGADRLVRSVCEEVWHWGETGSHIRKSVDIRLRAVHRLLKPSSSSPRRRSSPRRA